MWMFMANYPDLSIHEAAFHKNPFSGLKDTLKDYGCFKNKQKSVWSNAFLICKSMYIQYIPVCIVNTGVFNTLYIKINTNAKNFSFGQNIRYKNMLSVFLSRALTHHSFNFDLRFLYNLSHKVRLSICVWDFPFSIPFRFY